MVFLIALIMLSLIIFVHELGHFLAAKFFKIPVSEFAIGMGPQVFSCDTEKTMYSFRAIPIGGYVNIEGMEIDHEVENGFNTKPAYPRFIVLFGGVFMNFLSAFIILLLTFKMVGISEYSSEAIVGKLNTDKVNESLLQIDDKILEINGKKINNWNEISQGLKGFTDKDDITVMVERKGNTESLNLKLTHDKETDRYLLGISPKIETKKVNFVDSLVLAKDSFIRAFKDTLNGFFILFQGKVKMENLSGPVGIIKVVGEMARFGWLPLANLAVMLSINIGILNLLPFPALDGGRIIFVLLELVGIKLNKKWEENLHKGGMFLLLFAIVLISAHDIFKIFLS